ncbi:hypothetical protein SAMN04488540_102186 [Ferrimonas sediminum]|uniref:Uncharacterized protein n=1 Tax=Ferrimonas sediminum TaxID=718193 RepID=A0A1G8LVZ9_9GAMM|nr:ETEC_3214 domain-containing protein [Ferrimonas sediminum]SDI59803.1 hypothetical protein SAMN04488540_102186 [Ferrimonas sediminum]
MSGAEQESTRPSQSQYSDRISPFSHNWKKAKSGFLYFIALMIGFGNWNDTKELSTSIYSGIQANFTHQVEENSLQNIDVGNYLTYVEQDLGFPQVVKRSRQNTNIQFRYYKKNKYLITLLVEKSRINGYLVQTLDFQGIYSQLSAFSPRIPFSEKVLNRDTYSQFSDETKTFYLDNFNLVYYLEPHELGAEGMYLNLFIGTTEYGVMPGQLAPLIRAVTDRQTLGESPIKELQRLRSQLKPNLYGISGEPDALMAEALLTRYEFNTYF